MVTKAISVLELATRLKISTKAVYVWLNKGGFDYLQTESKRIVFTPDQAKAFEEKRAARLAQREQEQSERGN